MPGSWSQVLLHAVFATKNREALISAEVRPRLHEYMGGIVREVGGSLLCVGGIEDHVHALVRWRVDRAISDLMRDLKSGSSGWIHREFAPMRKFAWQEGYAVFSVSKSAQNRVARYIENQESHHRRRSFRDELIALLDAHGVEYDPKYLPMF